MQGRILRSWFVILALAGCQEAKPGSPPPRPSPVPLGQEFQPEKTGTISGRVLWQGAKPSVATFRVHRHWDMLPLLEKAEDRPNPFAPVIGEDRGLANAVVFLDKVDPKKSRPWDHPPVRMEFQDGDPEKLVALQGSQAGRVGILRLHDSFEAVNRQKVPQILKAQEGAYFGLPLIEPNVPTAKSLHETGPVEFCSGAGYYWMRSHLFVTEHPYAVVTGVDGSFSLSQVPEGEYRLQCWVANWHVDRHERDPEMNVKVRTYYWPGGLQEQAVSVRLGQTAPADFTWNESLFKK